MGIKRRRGTKGYRPKISTHLELDSSNGIYCTTGSLGHGLPIATGMAFARKKQKKAGKIFVMISDGECQEGTTWESSLIASKHKLDNLVLIVDYNKIQALSKLSDALPLDNLFKKFSSFNWNCINIKNGHNFSLLASGFKGGHKFVSHLFDERDDGFPSLTQRDESAKVPGVFLCGPSVRHDGHIFCFIFKYRQRFAIVAEALASSLDLPTDEFIEAYKGWGMYLDDLSCCGQECLTC